MIIDAVLSNRDFATEQPAIKVPSEKNLRSIVKSISWRVIGTLDTMIISWLITGELTLGHVYWCGRSDH